mmetsp:Transcript_26882/g.83647  ORF Transcript_26882/g.83647 Transcript_26882/m.83647 type:complete len:82 (-) Transcript_26882:1055-1300(-)
MKVPDWLRYGSGAVVGIAMARWPVLFLPWLALKTFQHWAPFSPSLYASARPRTYFTTGESCSSDSCFCVGLRSSCQELSSN